MLNICREHATAYGSLTRYRTIGPRGLKATSAFGIGRVEDFDPVIHEDATYTLETGEVLPDGSPIPGARVPNRAIVSRDPYENRDVVYDRWLPLLHKGAVVLANSQHTNARWQYYIIRPGQTMIGEQIYCAEIDLAEHQSIAKGRMVEMSDLIDSLTKWGSVMMLELPNPAKAGFRRKRVGCAKRWHWHYEVYARLVLRCVGANVTFRWEIAGPETPPYNGKSSTASGTR